MTSRAWIGQFQAVAFNKVGLRHKFPGQPWQEPYANHHVPLLDDHLKGVSDRYAAGLPVARTELPDCSAVYDAKCFGRQKHVSRAGYSYIVDDKLAALLSEFDLGSGGMTPYDIYEADESTPIKRKWWLLGLGAQKNSLLPEQSQNIELIFDGKGEKNNLYMLPFPPGDDAIAFSQEALTGADIWRERDLMLAFGFSDRLGAALMNAGLGALFGLQRARVLD